MPRIVTALLLVFSFVLHDGLMAARAMHDHAPNTGVRHHASHEAPDRPDAPGDCWTVQTIIQPRGQDVAPLPAVNHPAAWFTITATATRMSQPPAWSIQQRARPRALLQVWRI